MTPETPTEALDRLIAIKVEWPLYMVSLKDLMRIRELHCDVAPYRHPVKASAPISEEVE